MSVSAHYDSELSDFVHCPAEFGRLAVFGCSEESRANARWRYCLEKLWALVCTVPSLPRPTRMGANQTAIQNKQRVTILILKRLTLKENLIKKVILVKRKKSPFNLGLVQLVM